MKVGDLVVLSSAGEKIEIAKTSNSELIFQFGSRPYSGNLDATTQVSATQDTWEHPRDLSSSSNDAYKHGKRRAR